MKKLPSALWVYIMVWTFSVSAVIIGRLGDAPVVAGWGWVGVITLSAFTGIALVVQLLYRAGDEKQKAVQRRRDLVRKIDR